MVPKLFERDVGDFTDRLPDGTYRQPNMKPPASVPPLMPMGSLAEGETDRGSIGDDRGSVGDRASMGSTADSDSGSVVSTVDRKGGQFSARGKVDRDGSLSARGGSTTARGGQRSARPSMQMSARGLALELTKRMSFTDRGGATNRGGQTGREEPNWEEPPSVFAKLAARLEMEKYNEDEMLRQEGDGDAAIFRTRGGGIKLDILIGAGTFGSVYLARPLTQQAKQKEIAVRLLNPMALSLTKLNKIEREVESARTELSHTNLARLLEVVYNGKAQPGILMEVRDAHAHAS